MESKATEPTARIGFTTAPGALFHVLADDRCEVGLDPFWYGFGPGDERVLERRAAVAASSRRKFANRFRDGALRGLRILHQGGDNHFDGHRVMIGMPAVVVGDQRQR